MTSDTCNINFIAGTSISLLQRTDILQFQKQIYCTWARDILLMHSCFIYWPLQAWQEICNLLLQAGVSLLPNVGYWVSWKLIHTLTWSTRWMIKQAWNTPHFVKDEGLEKACTSSGWSGKWHFWHGNPSTFTTDYQYLHERSMLLTSN